MKGSAFTNAKGVARAVFRYQGSRFIGMALRARVSWAGDKAKLGGSSGWTQLRITS